MPLGIPDSQFPIAAIRTDCTTHRRSFNSPRHAHFLTFSCYHKRQFLTGDYARRCLAESIEFARHRHHFSLWAYVFMLDHVHLLLHPRHPEHAMADILRDIKEQPARLVIRYLREHAPWHLKLMEARQGRRRVHRFWQSGGGFDRNLETMDRVNKAVEYIEWNPVRRGYVTAPTEWRWSSAQARAGVDDVPLRMDPVAVELV